MSQTIRHGAAGEFGPDQRWTVGGKYVLHFTARGNLELWNTKAKRLIWQSETVEAVKLAMQDDGNLVIYGKGDKPLWASHTDGNPGAFLAMQEDGNLVIYSRDFRPIWSTDTSGS